MASARTSPANRGPATSRPWHDTPDWADLTCTDLRGASLWGAHSIEACGSVTDWERAAAAAVEHQMETLAGVTGGAAGKPTREQKGRFGAVCWIGQIFRHFDDPKPSSIADWAELPEWQRATSNDNAR